MSIRSVLASRYPLSVADPFLSLQRALQRSVDEAWGGLPANWSATTEAAAMSFALDVKEDDSAFHVSAELPGLTEKEVEVSFDDGVLTIRGKKELTRDEKKETWHIVERASGSFARRLSLTAPVDPAKIEASFEKGILSVTLPKLPQGTNNARKIDIKGA